MEQHTVDATQAPTQRRKRRRPGENRERLIEAGIREFARHGYRGASTTEIAAQAEVPQPHVYANFSTKQELFLACLKRVTDQLAITHAEQSTGETLTDFRSEGQSHGSSDEHEIALVQFLLQAVTSSAEAALQPTLGELLSRLHTAMGEHTFEALLLQGARALRTPR